MSTPPADTPELLFHLDLPTAVPAYAYFAVKGWVATLAPLRAVFAGPTATGQPLAFTPRPDVSAALPAYAHVSGFVGQATAAEIIAGQLHLTIITDRGEHPVTCPLTPPPFPPAAPQPDFPITPELKAEKIRRIAPHLACPACKAVLPHAPASDTCPACSAAFQFSPTLLDFFSPAQRATIPAVGATGDSLGGYDEVMNALVQRFADGLILDCGAGLKGRLYPNVINLEIMDYPSTDIRAFNESLPFATGTFDAVFTLATLEHVRDPFAAGAEIMRVLKPGGIVYSMVPLLVPYHGYPNHYYNMTVEGHRLVFGPSFEPLDASVPLSGNPMWALSGLLHAWHNGLAPSARDEFLNLRIGDLLAPPLTYTDRNFVRHLTPEGALEIAAMTRFIGRKRA
jgi:SAM-dependent methyltransferase